MGIHTLTSRAMNSGGGATRRIVWLFCLATLAVALSACGTEPRPLTITSFTSASITGGASYQWTITGDSAGTLTCGLDADGDGTADATVADCGTVTFHSHAFATPGRYTSKLTVSDGQGRSHAATVATIAAGTSTTPTTWAVQFGTSGDDLGRDLTSDANGNTTVVGTIDGALPGHASAGGDDIVLARYDPAGNQLWATQFGTSEDDDGFGITSDGHGNVVLVGQTEGALPGAASAGGLDVVIAKY